MEQPESSLPYSQAPATCPYPEPTTSSHHNPFPLPEDPSQYYPPIYVLVSLMVYIYIYTHTHTHMTRNADKVGTSLLRFIIQPCYTVYIQTFHNLHDQSHTHNLFSFAFSVPNPVPTSTYFFNLFQSFRRIFFFVINFTLDSAFINWMEIAYWNLLVNRLKHEC